MEAKSRLLIKEEDYREALTFLGFAQFNLNKGKVEATKTLIDKAIVALGGKAFYED